jgi:hypothetical protein
MPSLMKGQNLVKIEVLPNDDRLVEKRLGIDELGIDEQDR